MDAIGSIFDETIDLKDYTLTEIETYVHGYYENLDDLKEKCKDSEVTWKQLVAEIIAEQSDHS